MRLIFVVDYNRLVEISATRKNATDDKK